MRAKSFRKFLEEKESEASSPYIDALQDELGIDSADLEKDPQLASFFSLGADTKNIGLYKILRIVRDEGGKPTHAVVRTMEDRSIKDRRYRDSEGTLKRIEGDAEERTLVVPIEDLDKLLSQDFQPPPAPPGGAP
jgi:hypothetical protein